MGTWAGALSICASGRFEEFRATIAKQTTTRGLRGPGDPQVSAPPRHAARAEGAVEDFKNRMARPVCKRFFPTMTRSVCFNVSGLAANPGPRWRSARPGPHKLSDAEPHFLNQASGTPFDCQAISLSPLANIMDDQLQTGQNILRPPQAVPRW